MNCISTASAANLIDHPTWWAQSYLYSSSSFLLPLQVFRIINVLPVAHPNGNNSRRLLYIHHVMYIAAYIRKRNDCRLCCRICASWRIPALGWQSILADLCESEECLPTAASLLFAFPVSDAIAIPSTQVLHVNKKFNSIFCLFPSEVLYDICTVCVFIAMKIAELYNTWATPYRIDLPAPITVSSPLHPGPDVISVTFRTRAWNFEKEEEKNKTNFTYTTRWLSPLHFASPLSF